MRLANVKEARMKRFAVSLSIIAVLVGLAWLGGLFPRPAVAARPYEGQTIRAVVNAEYVKYSLSLIEKDLREARRQDRDGGRPR